MKTKLFGKTDLLILVLTLAAGLAAWALLKTGNGRMAVVEYNGKTVKTIDMETVEDEFFFTVEGDVAVYIGVSKKGVWFADSECPDKLCVRFGILSQRGDMAACVPAKVSIRITGLSKKAPDAVTG